MITKRQEATFGADGYFIILTAVIALWVYAYVKAHRIVYVKYAVLCV